jgi:hypothetical protein
MEFRTKKAPTTRSTDPFLQGLPIPGNPRQRGRLSTVDLLVKICCFVKKKNVVSI